MDLFINKSKAKKVFLFYKNEAKKWNKSLPEALSMYPLRYESKLLLDGDIQKHINLDALPKKEWEELAYLDFDQRLVRGIGPKKEALVGISVLGSAYYSDYEAIELLIESTADWISSNHEIPLPLLKALYPIPYEKEVRRFCREYHLDPLWVFAIMRETSQFLFSNFDYKEERSGVFNLKIKTGKEIALRVGDYWKDGSELLDPKKSIFYACFYLNWLKEKSNNNIYVQLATFYTELYGLGYYKHELQSFEEAKKEIKNQEIIRYIQRVLDSYLIYSVIYD